MGFSILNDIYIRMNYRDFYKKEQSLAGKYPLVENIDFSKVPPEILKGAEVELEHTPSRGKKIVDADPNDIKRSLKTAIDHYKEDKNYYQKLTNAGLEESDDVKSAERMMYGGFEPLQPVLGLDVPSRVKPVSISKIISPAACFGSRTQNGADSGLSPGIERTGKEKITAAGKVDTSVAQKSVGGPVVPSQGQEQGGPNTQGSIAGTPKEVSSSSKVAGQKGLNTQGSVGGTPRNADIGLKGSDLIRGGIGVTSNQSHLGQFSEVEPDEFEKANRRELDSMADTGYDCDDEEEEEEGEDVSITLNESIKKMVREVVTEAVKKVNKKNRVVQKSSKPKNKASSKKLTSKFKASPKPLKKPKTQVVSKLQKEATFISKKINEGRKLTDDERNIIKEIVVSKAIRIKEGFDGKGWEHAMEGQMAMMDAFIEDMVKYRSKDDDIEDLVMSIQIAAEDHLGIRHFDDEAMEQKVKLLMAKYPAKY